MLAYKSNLNETIKPLLAEIVNHSLYPSIETMEHMKIFMQYHVYAVWDFMSLLKSLQQNLTCVSVPWFPAGDADSRYLINEIVCGEESDVDLFGIRKSHFEMYLDAMDQCGADTSGIKIFIETLKSTGNLETAFDAANTPAAARSFVQFTFKVINTNKSHIQSAVFTYGREDLIPGMFVSILNDLDKNFPNKINLFKYYIERHIEVDGDHHSNLAIEMTNNLCGDNDVYWQQAQENTIAALQKRKQLWDGVLENILLIS